MTDDPAAPPRTPARPAIEIDLVPDQTSDDTDAGWGTASRDDRDPATVLRRYLDEKPPHHGD